MFLSSAIDADLLGSSRIPWGRTARAGTLSARDVLVLLGLGAAAALTRYLVKFHLGIPGHSIILVVLPLALGTAAVPRRGAGTMLSGAAVATALALNAASRLRGPGPGALTSLAITGVAFDLCLALWRGKYRVYLAWISAGMTANLIAFAVRATGKFTGVWPGLHTAAFWKIWASRAALTYPLCGLIAGLMCAGVCFRPSRKSPGSDQNAEPGRHTLPRIHR